jgi:hypothetical protein
VLLGSATGRGVLGTWPQYSDGAVGVDGGNRPHMHLNVLRYYLVRSSAFVMPHTWWSGQLWPTLQHILSIAACDCWTSVPPGILCDDWFPFTLQAWFAFYVLRGSVADGELGTAPQRPGGYIGSLNPGQFTGSVLKVQRRGPVMRLA